MAKKLVIAAVLLALLAGAATVAWQACGMPPPRLVLKYGYPSPMGPTGRTLTIEGVEFVEISPGYFRMGSHYLCDRGDLLGQVCAPVGLPWGRHPRHGSECPVHWVEFHDGFWISRHEITNAQYEKFENGRRRTSYSPGDEHPAVGALWAQAQAYCNWLALRSGHLARLPSESAWECASRAGSASRYCFGDDQTLLADYAWHDTPEGMMPVGSLKPNRWGLFDFHGNAWEWCEDTVHARYRNAPTDGTAWIDLPSDGALPVGHVVRLGGCISPAPDCRSASRYWLPPTSTSQNIGFRPRLYQRP